MPYSARPPGLMSRFRMITSWPPCAIFCAANIPAGPAPTTKTVFKRVLPRYTGTRFEQASPSPAEMSFKCEQLPLLSLTIRDHARPKFHHITSSLSSRRQGLYVSSSPARPVLLLFGLSVQRRLEGAGLGRGSARSEFHG